MRRAYARLPTGCRRLPERKQTKTGALLGEGFGELAAELSGVDAMLGSFVGSDENHGYVVAVEGRELRVFVDVDLAEDGVELR